MFERKFDIWMFCVNIFYKLFQLLMRIKGDKNIISIPPINVRTKIFGLSESQCFLNIYSSFLNIIFQR